MSRGRSPKKNRNEEISRVKKKAARHSIKIEGRDNGKKVTALPASDPYVTQVSVFFFFNFLQNCTQKPILVLTLQNFYFSNIYSVGVEPFFSYTVDSLYVSAA